VALGEQEEKDMELVVVVVEGQHIIMLMVETEEMEPEV